MSDTDEVPGQPDRPEGDVPLVYEPIVAAAEVAHRQLTPAIVRLADPAPRSVRLFQDNS
jgi:hypothetical protein